MLLFDGFNVGDLPEVQLINLVTYIQCLDMALHYHTCELALISVTADMKVTRHLFDSKRPDKSASVVFGEGLFCHFVLSHLVWLSEEFEVSAFDSLT